MVDWNAEKENLGSGEYYKPEAGTHEIKFLDKGEDTTKEFDPAEGAKTFVEFQVEVNGEEKIWSVYKGTSERSLWGQIVEFAIAREGEIVGEVLKLKRIGTGKETTYAVLN